MTAELNSNRNNCDWFSSSYLDPIYDGGKLITVRKSPKCEYRFIVKEIQKSPLETIADFRQRVYNEAEIQHLLRSEFVPVLFNYLDEVELNERFLLAMEFATISLDRLLFYKEHLNQPIPLFVVQRWTRGGLAGLDYLDQIGVVHRDLKPSNLLIISQSMHSLDLRHARFLISDFGSAYRIETTYPKGNTNITLQYSAPELLCVDGVATSKSDLFSLIIILIKCVTYQHVFLGLNVLNHRALNSLTDLRKLFFREPQLIVGESAFRTAVKFPFRMFTPVPIIHLEDDSLHLAQDFCSFVLTCMKPDKTLRPTPRIALNHAFLKLRDLKGDSLVYRTTSIRWRNVLTNDEKNAIVWSSAAKSLNDCIGI